MPTLPYFNNFKSGAHQSLIERQIVESIKRTGHEIKYIPRDIVKDDKIFGEDVLSKFTDAAVIEAYVKEVDGYGGQGKLMSKFGFEVRDKVTFTISRLRFKQIQTEKLMLETSYVMQNENRQKYKYGETQGFILEDGSRDGYSITWDIPREGDLIYFGMVDRLFEIQYVSRESLFYQHGALYTFDLECEFFEYSSERFETNDSNINEINKFSTDVTFNELIGEDGNEIELEETEGSVVNETPILDDQIPSAQNNEIQKEADDIIDFSKINPLIERSKW